METKQHCYDKTIKNYNKLVSNVKSLFKKNKELQKLEINEVDMVNNLDLFVNELSNKDDFKLFVNKKEKLFSKKKKHYWQNTRSKLFFNQTLLSYSCSEGQNTISIICIIISRSSRVYHMGMLCPVISFILFFFFCSFFQLL